MHQHRDRAAADPNPALKDELGTDALAAVAAVRRRVYLANHVGQPRHAAQPSPRAAAPATQTSPIASETLTTLQQTSTGSLSPTITETAPDPTKPVPHHIYDSEGTPCSPPS